MMSGFRFLDFILYWGMMIFFLLAIFIHEFVSEERRRGENYGTERWRVGGFYVFTRTHDKSHLGDGGEEREGKSSIHVFLVFCFANRNKIYYIHTDICYFFCFLFLLFLF